MIAFPVLDGSLPPDAAATATALVEAELRRPIGLVTDYTDTYYVNDLGTIELPYRPVRSVTSVLDHETHAPVFYVLLGNRLTDCPCYAWLDVTYDHGWDTGPTPMPPLVPPIISVVIARLAARLGQNATGVVREGIGGRTGYTVDFGDGFAELTEGERRMLRPYRCAPGVAGSYDTREPRPSDWPAPGWPWSM